MEVYLDQQLYRPSDPPPVTLAELVERIAVEVRPTNRALLRVVCDGAEISTPGLEDRLAQPLEQFNRIEFHTGPAAVLVQDALEQSLELLNSTAGPRREAADALTQGRTQEAATLLGDCLQGWAQVHQAIVQSVVLLKLDASALTVGDQPLEAALETIVTQLRGIKEALAAGDYVLLADILQYEFDDVTRRWQGVIEAVLQSVPPTRLA